MTYNYVPPVPSIIKVRFTKEAAFRYGITYFEGCMADFSSLLNLYYGDAPQSPESVSDSEMGSG